MTICVILRDVAKDNDITADRYQSDTYSGWRLVGGKHRSREGLRCDASPRAAVKLILNEKQQTGQGETNLTTDEQKEAQERRDRRKEKTGRGQKYTEVDRSGQKW